LRLTSEEYEQCAVLLRNGGPGQYMRSLGWPVFPFQQAVYDGYLEPTMMVAARQVGKTFCIGGLAYFIARTQAFSISAIVCPDQDKSKTLIDRVREIGRKDNATWSPDNTEELGVEGSRILGLPGTVKGVVSKTAKLLVFDEAGLMLGEQGYELYAAATPMQAHVDNPLTFAISSAWWQDGWFWEEWSGGKTYRKILVLPRWILRGKKILPAEMSDKELYAEYKEQGIHAFYAETPARDFLRMELERHGERYVRQQYMCEFLEKESKMFKSEWLDRATDNELSPLFSGPVVENNGFESKGILADVLGGRA